MLLTMKCFGFVMLLLFKFGDSSSTCPDSNEIFPCECSYSEFLGSQITCTGDILESDIENVFQATFPVKNFDFFVIDRNDIITGLSFTIVNGITFNTIEIHDNQYLTHIDESFFVGQGESLTNLYVNKNKLGSEGFPYSVLPNLPYLDKLDLTWNRISSLPEPIPANIITTMAYQYNIINRIKQATFVNCNALKSLDLTYNSMETLDKGNNY